MTDEIEISDDEVESFVTTTREREADGRLEEYVISSRSQGRTLETLVIGAIVTVGDKPIDRLAIAIRGSASRCIFVRVDDAEAVAKGLTDAAAWLRNNRR